MTDKQMIVDGVDVSECEHHVCLNTSLFKEKTLVQCSAFFLENEDSCCECSDNPNCYYKQLKRKEQECEELKSVRDSWISKCEQETKIRELYQDGLDQLKAENEKMSKGYAELTEIVRPYIDDFTGYNEKLGGFDIVLCVKELLQQLDQLKSENEHLSGKEEEAKHYLEESEKFKNCLTEIKEILGIHKDDKCAICPKFDECFEHPSCDNIILQKISEAIDE